MCREKAAKQLDPLPLSNDTVTCRIIDMAGDVKSTMIERVKMSTAFQLLNEFEWHRLKKCVEVCLSRGKVLTRLFELHSEVQMFLHTSVDQQVHGIEQSPVRSDFDLGDVLDMPGPTKPPVTPKPKKPSGGGSFDNDDLGYVAGEGDYNPDKGKGGGRSGAEGSGKIAGIVSAVGVALLGAASSYFAYQKKKLCFKISGVTDEAFVTLATSDVYCQGALVLGQSLRQHGTSRMTAVLITPQVSSSARAALARVFDEVVEVSGLDSGDLAHLAMLRRPELGITFTKLQCWTLTQYTKCVFLDADTLVLCNVDELFDREELSAAPDPGWPDCFNSGVFVFRPSLETYNQLLLFAMENGSFDGGDQGILNSFFGDWAVKDIHKHLPFVYNLSSSAVYSYRPAFRQYGHKARIVHFLGSVKPWHYKYNPQTRSAYQEPGFPAGSHSEHFVNLWWEVYSSGVVPLVMQHSERRESEQQHCKYQVGSVEISVREEEPAVPSHTEYYPPELENSVPTQTSSDEWQWETPEDLPREEVTVVELEIQAPVPQHSPSETPAEDLVGHDHLNSTELVTVQRLAKEMLLGLFSDRTDELPSPHLFHPLAYAYLKGVDLMGTVSELSIDVKPELPVDTKRELSDSDHRRMWEEGRMDYMGEDAFENIQKKLDRFLE
ncbi:GLYG2 protein, partial [Atractosteus spatula]|nr:GLYG2 protein [Atractosteus spatula]